MIRGRDGQVPLAVALVDVLCRALDGVWALAARGYVVSPEDDEFPEDFPAEWAVPPGEAFGELAALAGSCRMCRFGPSSLGEHYMQLQHQKWEQARPVWRCSCGARYKRVGRLSGEPEFWTFTRDGLFDRKAGVIRRDGKGRVKAKDSGACPRCRVPFAQTVTARIVPADALF